MRYLSLAEVVALHKAIIERSGGALGSVTLEPLTRRSLSRNPLLAVMIFILHW